MMTRKIAMHVAAVLREMWGCRRTRYSSKGACTDGWMGSAGQHLHMAQQVLAPVSFRAPWASLVSCPFHCRTQGRRHSSPSLHRIPHCPAAEHSRAPWRSNDILRANRWRAALVLPNLPVRTIAGIAYYAATCQML